MSPLSHPHPTAHPPTRAPSERATGQQQKYSRGNTNKATTQKKVVHDTEKKPDAKIRSHETEGRSGTPRDAPERSGTRRNAPGGSRPRRDTLNANGFHTFRNRFLIPLLCQNTWNATAFNTLKGIKCGCTPKTAWYQNLLLLVIKIGGTPCKQFQYLLQPVLIPSPFGMSGVPSFQACAFVFLCIGLKVGRMAAHHLLNESWPQLGGGPLFRL